MQLRIQEIIIHIKKICLIYLSYFLLLQVCSYKDCEHSCDTNLSRLGISVQRHDRSGVD